MKNLITYVALFVTASINCLAQTNISTNNSLTTNSTNNIKAQKPAFYKITLHKNNGGICLISVPFNSKQVIEVFFEDAPKTLYRTGTAELLEREKILAVENQRLQRWNAQLIAEKNQLPPGDVEVPNNSPLGRRINRYLDSKDQYAKASERLIAAQNILLADINKTKTEPETDHPVIMLAKPAGKLHDKLPIWEWVKR